MFKRLLGLAVLLVVAGRLLGDVEIPAEAKGEIEESIFIIPDKVDGGAVKWKLGSGLVDVTEKYEKLFGIKAKGRIVKARTDGTYYVWAWNAKGDVASDLVECKVTVGKGGPGPVPPGPKPPNPPDPPEPKPSPAPIPVEGFRVLIVYDYAALTNRKLMSEGQHSIMRGKAVRDYLKANCAVDRSAEQDGKAYRIWPSTANPTAVGLESWKAAMARPRTSLPWVIISNHPKGGYEGPMPDDPDKMIELMKKYAEPTPPMVPEKGEASSSGILPPGALDGFARDPLGWRRRGWLPRLSGGLLVKGGR